MTRLFWMREDEEVTAKHGGHVDASNRWKLPGLMCPTCGTTWSTAGHNYPCVDLSPLPEHIEFERRRPEPLAEFTRLQELVRPLAPHDAALPPGTGFGPLEGSSSGKFGAFAWVSGILLLVRRDALERLEARGIRGLVACPTALKFRQKNHPELLDLQIQPRGRLHPDCLPANTPPPCDTCNRQGFARPEQPILDAVSMPADLDLFRVGNFATMLVGTERLRDTVNNLALDGVTFSELRTR